jgi:precorrin isomerase
MPDSFTERKKNLKIGTASSLQDRINEHIVIVNDAKTALTNQQALIDKGTEHYEGIRDSAINFINKAKEQLTTVRAEYVADFGVTIDAPELQEVSDAITQVDADTAGL